MRSKIKLIAIVALALLAGCSKVGNEDGNVEKNEGYFVLNSGNINVNNSNISVFNIDNKELIGITYKPQLGLKGIAGIIKVRVNHLGEIVHVGE